MDGGADDYIRFFIGGEEMYKYLNLLTVILFLLKVSGLVALAWWKVFIPTYILVGMLLFWLLVLGIVSVAIHVKERGHGRG